MSDIDPVAVMAAHERHGGSGGCYPRATTLYLGDLPHCEPYRLAKALADEQAERTSLAAEQAKINDTRLLLAQIDAYARLCHSTLKHIGHIPAPTWPVEPCTPEREAILNDVRNTIGYALLPKQDNK